MMRRGREKIQANGGRPIIVCHASLTGYLVGVDATEPGFTLLSCGGIAAITTDGVIPLYGAALEFCADCADDAACLFHDDNVLSPN
jgi:hypothetical protein